MVFAMIFVGVFFIQIPNSHGKGFWHLGLTTFGYGTLGCAAALVLS